MNSQEEYRRFGIHALHQLAVVPTSSFRRAVPAVPGCLSIRRPDRSAGVLRGNGSSPSAGRTDEESGGHVKGLGVFLSVRLAAYNKSREVTRQLSTRVSLLSTGPSAGIAGREGVVATFGAPHAVGHRAAGRRSRLWPSVRWCGPTRFRAAVQPSGGQRRHGRRNRIPVIHDDGGLATDAGPCRAGRQSGSTAMASTEMRRPPARPTMAAERAGGLVGKTSV